MQLRPRQRKSLLPNVGGDSPILQSRDRKTSTFQEKMEEIAEMKSGSMQSSNSRRKSSILSVAIGLD